MAYATVNDLESRWRDLTPSESERAETLLDDAAVILERYEGGNLGLLKIVSCNMVKRAMETNGDAFGLDGQTTPSYGWGDSLPVGELKPTRSELSMLRGGGKIGTVEMTA